jgi:hypothetical protein
MSFTGGEPVREMSNARDEVKVWLDANGTMVRLTVTDVVGTRVVSEGTTLFERRDV